MSRLSLLRDRRTANVREERKQSFLVFNLGSDRFALPLLAVQKVSILGTLFGDPQQSGIGLTVHEGQQLAVIDVERRILQRSPQLSPSDSSATRTQEQTTTPVHPTQFLLILQNAQGEIMGLPVDSKPKIQAFAEQSLNPLPPTYEDHAAIHCVSSLMIDNQDQPIFVLNPDLVCQSLNGHAAIPLTSAEMPTQDSQRHTQGDYQENSEEDSQVPLPQAMSGVKPEMERPENASTQALDFVPTDPANPLAEDAMSWQTFSMDGPEIDWEKMPMMDFAGSEPVESLEANASGQFAPSVDMGTLDWESISLDEFQLPDFPIDVPELEPSPVSTTSSPCVEASILDPLNWEEMPVLDPASSPASSIVPPTVEASAFDPLNWDEMPIPVPASSPASSISSSSAEAAAFEPLNWEEMAMEDLDLFSSMDPLS